MSDSKTILFFGFFDEEYSRNRVLIKGAKDLGYTVMLCKVNPRKYGSVSKFVALYKEYKKIRKEKFDFVFVAFPGHSVVWLAYLLFGRKKIFDMFVSLYNSEVEDRKNCSVFSLKAFYFWFLDWYSVLLPQKILLDTNTHISFLSKRFPTLKKKSICVYVGSDDSVVYPVEKTETATFIVHFHGTGIPLQGIQYIIDAANELRHEEGIEFRLYGNNGRGVYKEAVEQSKKLKLTNVSFREPFPYSEMSKVLGEADVVLGIFGDTLKTQNVIPNKVFEGWAARKPVITARTPAILELGSDHQNVLLCGIASGVNIANSVRLLKKDSILSYKIAEGGYSMYSEKLVPKVLVKDFFKDMKVEYIT